MRSSLRTWATVAVLGCAPSPPPAPAAAPAAKAALPTPRAESLTRDPEPPDEALRAALLAFQDRFQCNAISGCSSHAVLRGFGWQARPLVEQAFARANLQSSWRARSVLLLAEIADPASEPFFARLGDDRDPEVRAWAAFGLSRLGAGGHEQALREQATADSLWLAPARLAALWALHGLGRAEQGRQFQRDLQDLSRQQMAATALVVAAYLCQQPGSPDCGAALPLLARHPNFQVRRDAAWAMTARLRPSYAAALVYLTDDQARSIRERAEEGLVALSGQATVTGHSGWASWCAATGCERLGPVND